MDRRAFLESIAAVSAWLPGLSFIGALSEPALAQLQSQARAATAPRTLSAHQDATVTAIAEMILPHTDTPGAKAVGVNRFIDLLLTQAMPLPEREQFLAGLAAIDVRSQSLYGAPFIAAPSEQQLALVTALDAKLPVRGPSRAEAQVLAREPISAERGYAFIKWLTVLGYFTAEPIARELLIAAPIIPGRYDGCIAT